MNIIGIASRNIGRNKRRSLLSMLAVVAACALLVFMMAFQKGTYLNWINNTVQAHPGHLQVQYKGYLEDGDLSLNIQRPDAVMSKLKGYPHIKGFAPRVNAPALISLGARTFGVLIWGIDPELEAKTSTLPEVIREGQYLTADDTDGVLVSKLLARNLDAKIGDQIVFLGQGADGSLAAGRLKIKGFFKFGINEMDRAIIVAHIRTIQEIFSMNDGVSEVAVLLDNDAVRAETVAALTREFQRDNFHDIVVVGWPELMPGIEQGIKMDWNSAIIMYTVLVLVVGFGIANTFLMAFMERIREYGILLALGMKPLTLSFMAYAESVLLMMAGVIGGILVGILVVVYFMSRGIYIRGTEELYAEYGLDPVIYPHLNVEVILWAAGIVTIITALMAIYPAVKAGRLKPAEALRKG